MSMQPRRQEIIQGLQKLPGTLRHSDSSQTHSMFPLSPSPPLPLLPLSSLSPSPPPPPLLPLPLSPSSLSPPPPPLPPPPIGLIKETLTLDKEIRTLAEDLHKQKSLIVMGRGYNFATCLEGALVCVRTCIHRVSWYVHVPVNYVLWYVYTMDIVTCIYMCTCMLVWNNILVYTYTFIRYMYLIFPSLPFPSLPSPPLPSPPLPSPLPFPLPLRKSRS